MTQQHRRTNSTSWSSIRYRFAVLAVLALPIFVFEGCDDADSTRKVPGSSQPSNATSSIAKKNKTDAKPNQKSGSVTDGDGKHLPESGGKFAIERRKLDETVWADERLAQEYEAALVDLWDQLLKLSRANGDKYELFKSISLNQITLGNQASVTTLDHGIQQVNLGKTGKTYDRDGWIHLLDEFKGRGYRLIQSEWHHAAFFPANGTNPPRSSVSVLLHIVNPDRQSRISIDGKLKIEWFERENENEKPVPKTIDATQLRILERRGKPVFEEVLSVDPTTPGKPSGIHPLICYDLNGDGLSEILATGCNRVYWNLGGGRFRQDTLLAAYERGFEVGLVADITGDGYPDLVMPGIRGDVLLYQGDKNGQFNRPPLGRAKGGGPLKQPQALTAGDIDNDGDLDLWIGQYKISYAEGQMPSPYYDANDGLPGYLLLNQGGGRFDPATEEAGLEKKRKRRTYTSSFVDLDDDGDLDLLVVSDFAGIDVYHNDGEGFFEDVTDRLVDQRHLFGMSATFGDYNLDGHLDFFVAGMSSTTARRLEQMRLGRRDRPDIHLKRMQMAYGNRMYMTGDGRYRQPQFRDQVARTGWTWGTTTLDFDNDGDPDLFAANGHSSGKSTKDHCTHFWCHDIYEANSNPNPLLNDLFKEVHKGYLNRSESWDGYQKNKLLMNIAGKGFVDVAFLMGVGHEFDGRAAISDDLDGDGRMDLLVVEDNWFEGQILHVYMNRLESRGNWIGVRLRESPGAASPIGASVIVNTVAGRKIAKIVTGESIHGQHAPTAHFGLGELDHVQSIEVVWPYGKHRQHIKSPEINKYHDVSAK